MRICIISEELNEPFDEGIKNFVYSLTRALSKDNQVLPISVCGEIKEDGYTRKLRVNRAFLNYKLFQTVRKFNSQAILYVPSPSITFFSFIRSRILKFYAKHASVVMIGLQPRKYSSISEALIPLMAPDLLLVQSRNVLRQLRDLGCYTRFMPSGVDVKRFYPVSHERKLELRRKYGIHYNDFLVLHVGHINRNRNVQFLKELQGNGVQILLVGSTSTQQDKALAAELMASGVEVISDYVDKIQEIYQSADCYLFQVISESASIEIPLSVLEAMSCNLPVVTTRYGGLPVLFEQGNGMFFVNDISAIPEKLRDIRRTKSVGTSLLVQSFSWENVAARIIHELSDLGRTS